MNAPTSRILKSATKQVRPLLSLNEAEAKRRVLNLYRAWYRQIPYIVFEYHIPRTVPDLRKFLRSVFEKNRNVKDIRVIDMLVVKGEMELKETLKHWKQDCHVMNFLQETVEPKPQGFLSKFLANQP